MALASLSLLRPVDSAVSSLFRYFSGGTEKKRNDTGKIRGDTTASFLFQPRNHFRVFGTAGKVKGEREGGAIRGRHRVAKMKTDVSFERRTERAFRRVKRPLLIIHALRSNARGCARDHRDGDVQTRSRVNARRVIGMPTM